MAVRKLANVAGISHNMPHIAKKILHVCRANFNIHFVAPTAANVKKTNEQSQVGHLGSFDKTNITLSYLSDNSFGIYNSNKMVGRFSSERKRKTSFMLEPLIYWKTEVNVDFLRFSWVMRNNYKISSMPW